MALRVLATTVSSFHFYFPDFVSTSPTKDATQLSGIGAELSWFMSQKIDVYVRDKQLLGNSLAMQSETVAIFSHPHISLL